MAPVAQASPQDRLSPRPWLTQLAGVLADHWIVARFGLGLLQSLLAQPTGPPLVHGVDGAVVALGVGLPRGNAIYLADGESSLDESLAGQATLC